MEYRNRTFKLTTWGTYVYPWEGQKVYRITDETGYYVWDFSKSDWALMSNAKSTSRPIWKLPEDLPKDLWALIVLNNLLK